jgi:NAD+ kinase
MSRVLRVLVVCKTIQPPLSAPAHEQTKEELFSLFRKFGIFYQEVERRTVWPSLGDFDGIVTIGGDGTLLEASHHIKDSKSFLLGIKSSPGSVGYLCNPKEPHSLLLDLVNHSLKPCFVPRLKARIVSLNQEQERVTEPILNDFLYTNSFPAGTTRYQIFWDGKDEHQKSSGIWISTGAGSTAGIAGSGGIACQREEEKFQFAVRELYMPPGAKKQKIKKGFLNLSSFKIQNLTYEGILALDGSHGFYPLEYGDTITFEAASPLRLYI